MRPYRIVSGPAYPLKLKEGRDIYNSKIDRSINNRRDYYHSDAVRLSKQDVAKFKGKPIRVEHEENVEVGEVTDTWVGEDNSMWMTSRIYTDTKIGQQVMECVDNEEFLGLSVGMQPITDGEYVVDMDAEEISVCQKGFFEGARVAIAASDKTNYKNSGRVFIKIRAMSEEKVNNPAPQAVDQDKAEIARAHDEATKRLEAQNKELAELRAWKEAEEKRKAAEQAAYEERRKADLAQHLAVALENAKAERGEDATLSETTRDVATNAFLDPTREDFATEIRASELYKKKIREERNELESKMNKQKKETDEILAQIQASNARVKVLGATEPVKSEEVEPIQASAGSNVQSLFENALSEYDRAIFQRDYPAFLGAVGQGMPGIKASAVETISRIPAAPTHRYLDECRNSYRYLSPQQEKLFSFVVQSRPELIPRPDSWGPLRVNEERFDP